MKEIFSWTITLILYDVTVNSQLFDRLNESILAEYPTFRRDSASVPCWFAWHLPLWEVRAEYLTFGQIFS